MGEAAMALANGVAAIKNARKSVLKDTGITDLRNTAGNPSGNSGDPGVNLAPMSSAQAPNVSGATAPGVDPLAPLPDASPEQGQAMGPMASSLLGQSQAPPAPAPQVDNPYAPDTPKELTGQPIEVVGDDWKPKKEDLLGKIADTILLLRGRRPVFRDKVDSHNMESALQGFQKDPETAIARVRQVDPEKAWQMNEDLSRVKANQALETQRMIDTRNKAGDIMGSMVNAITDSKNPEEIYAQKLPTIRKFAEYYGYDPSLLPDTYDKDTMNFIRQKGFSAYEQERLKDFDQTEARQADYQDRSLQALTQDRQARLEEEKRNHDIDNALAREKFDFDKTKTENGKPGPKNIFNKDTGEYRGLMSPDGQQAAVLGPDGKWKAYRLQRRGDLSSRVRAPAEDEIVNKKMGGK